MGRCFQTDETLRDQCSPTGCHFCADLSTPIRQGDATATTVDKVGGRDDESSSLHPVDESARRWHGGTYESGDLVESERAGRTSEDHEEAPLRKCEIACGGLGDGGVRENRP